MKKIFIFLFVLLLITVAISACGDDDNNNSSVAPHVTSSEFEDTTSADISDVSIESDNESVDISTTVSDNVSDTVSDTVSNGTDTSGTVSEVSGALSAPYIDIINSGVYMIKMTDVPEMVGDAILKNDIAWYFKNGGYVTEKEEYGTTVRTVVEGDCYYDFMNEFKTIMKNPIEDFIPPYIPDLTDLTHFEDGIDVVDGVTYDLEKFKDSDGKTVTFMFKNDILVRMRSYIPSMDEYAEYEVEIKTSYDQSVFDLPSDYEIVDFT